VITSTGAKLLSAKFAAVGLHKELLIVDTPAAMIEDVSEAIVLADYAVMVVRPTLLDIAGMVRSYQVVRSLQKPFTVVVSQAQVPRQDEEAPLVKRALRALEYMRAPMAPVIVRSRAVYQTALERGRSAEEMTDKAAAKEMAALWDYVKSQLDGLREDELADEAAALAEAMESLNAET